MPDHAARQPQPASGLRDIAIARSRIGHGTNRAQELRHPTQISRWPCNRDFHLRDFGRRRNDLGPVLCRRFLRLLFLVAAGLGDFIAPFVAVGWPGAAEASDLTAYAQSRERPQRIREAL